jgi:hypothetical protein
MNNPDQLLSNYARQREIRKRLGPINKAAILDALAAGAITLVLVQFDGIGDSGQIEDITAMRGDASVPLPEATVKIHTAEWGAVDPVIKELPLAEAIETLCYDFLEDKHAGWEINDGSFGEFQIDVTERTVDLEFNGRFTDVSTSHYSF